jgi:hypothetical protein
MRIHRIAVASCLIVSLSAPALAGDLLASVAHVEDQLAQQAQAPQREMSKAYLWPGAALFVSGMAMAVTGFLNNRNGDFPTFGEATATNVKMGGAGLAMAFTGGTLLFLGKRNANRSPSVTFGAGRVTVSKQVSW